MRFSRKKRPFPDLRSPGGRQIMVGFFFVLFTAWIPSILPGKTPALENRNAPPENTARVSALDEKKVKRIGKWEKSSFRYAANSHLFTSLNGAALEFPFEGTGVALRLGNHAVPAYGTPHRGRLLVTIDGKILRTIHPLSAPREIVLARGLAKGPHTVRVEHRGNGENAGCRIESFLVLNEPGGDLLFQLNGEENAFLVDARAVLRKDGKVVRNTPVRNWLSGQCSLVGLKPGTGYSLEIEAIGWQPVAVNQIEIKAGQTTQLAPVFLVRDENTVSRGFRFPALNRPAIREPGRTFRVRFMGYQVKIKKVELRRVVGPAVISRELSFEEDQSVGYYYDREIIAKIPADMPPGVYDLFVQVADKNPANRRAGIRQSPRSVTVVPAYPKDPVLLTFGHLDTAGQVQAEYLKRLVSMANLLAPDLVLNSNAANSAYISGALAGLDMPYVINFGNHQFYGHEKWYGDPVGLIEFGPDFVVLNFGRPWHDASSRMKATSLLNIHPACRYKIINAFEPNAEIAWLNKHRICMVHFAHGRGGKNIDVGTTPTRLVGKTNSVSFRIVRLQNGKVKSASYHGHPTMPVPFSRDATPPLRVRFSPKNDGTHSEIRATLTNEYAEDFPRCRVRFLLPAGDYRVDRGQIESSILSDDKKFVVLSIRVDAPAENSITINVQASPKQPE